ncbi:MAG: uracil-DNA glycosylase [Gloeobacteraceae cyanobacterium ES-bin-144]|nr:uracil-DNA glycosylase [Verrucomicrobiales bacterium]
MDTFIGFLEAERDRGISHVLLDEGAREGLRKLQKLAQKPSLPVASLAASPLPAANPTPKAVVTNSILKVLGTTKVERLASLKQQAENWLPAKELQTLRETMVFATGNPDARLMLVGEAPGHEEEKLREPFVGPAGQKLNDILKAMGLSREEIYISNIVKFRPATPRQTTNNRKPSPEEMAACMPFIRSEIKIIQPACIVALGGTAAEGLLNLSGTVASMRGSWHSLGGIPVRVTYHPSYLLQSGANLSIKRQLWEDMLTVMEQLTLPISEKQRDFFLPKN